MKRHLKWLVVLFVVLIVLFMLILTLGRGDTSKNRRIANGLFEYHRCCETNGDLGSVLSLIGFPFRNGGIIDHPLHIDGFPRIVSVSHEIMHDFIEYYWLENSMTNSSEWTLYHYWEWKGHRLVTHKLLAIVETNAESNTNSAIAKPEPSVAYGWRLGDQIKGDVYTEPSGNLAVMEHKDPNEVGFSQIYVVATKEGVIAYIAASGNDKSKYDEQKRTLLKAFADEYGQIRAEWDSIYTFGNSNRQVVLMADDKFKSLSVRYEDVPTKELVDKQRKLTGKTY